jgi:hypothetical protein
MTADLAARIARIEDFEAIRRLKHRYCELCDDHYNAAGIADLFAHDGVWDAGEGYGRYVGRAAIAAFFRTMPSAVSFSAHMVLNEQIDLADDNASGRWRAIVPASFRMEGVEVPHWLITAYEDIFRREAGVWRFTLLRSIVHRSFAHLKGW